MTIKFDKISTTSVTESVSRVILKSILSGELQVGDRLPPERDLAEQMGVSRSSLHQAIVDLESKGFLQIRPRHGTVVSDYRKYPTAGSLGTIMSYASDELDHDLFTDMMDTRIWLETECARRACTHIYKSTFDAMTELAKRMETESGNPGDLVYTFHYMLTQASGNSLFSMIYRGFESMLRTLIIKHYDVCATDKSETSRLHLELLDAISQKDEDLAQEKVRAILTQGIRVLEQSYEIVLKI